MKKNGTYTRKPQIGFPVTAELQIALEEVRQRTGVTVAHMGREALWEKIAEIHRTHPAYQSDRAAVTEQTAGNGGTP